MSAAPASNVPQTWATLYESDTVCTKDASHTVAVVLETWHEIGNDQHDVDHESLRPHESATRELVKKYQIDGELSRGYVIIGPLSGVDPNIPLMAHESALNLVDRTLTFGETVKRNPTDSISGTVVGQGGTVDIRHSLATEDGIYTSPNGQSSVQFQTIKGVSIDDVRHSGDWKYGEYVVWKNCWLGIVEDVVEDVTIRLDSGSVVTVEDSSLLKLIFTQARSVAPTPNLSRRSTNSQPTARHPAVSDPDGSTRAQNVDDQQIEGPAAERWEIGNWVSTTKGNLRRGQWKYGQYSPNQTPSGVVVDVSINSLCINWQCQNMMVRDRFVPVEAPDQWQYGEATISELKRFKIYMGDTPHDGSEVFQIGDKVRFDNFAEAEAKYQTDERIQQKKGFPTKIPREWMFGYDVNTYVVIGTESCVQVQWQDTTSTWERCTSLSPYENLDEHDVWPGDMVITRPENATDNAPKKLTLPVVNLTGDPAVADTMDIDEELSTMTLLSPEKVGVVQTVDAKERVARVRWFESPKIEIAGNMIIPGSSTGKLMDGPGEEVSLYEVSVHPALAIKLADLVLIAPEQGITVSQGQPQTFGAPASSRSSQPEPETQTSLAQTLPAQTSPAQTDAEAQTHSSLQWMVNSMRGIVDTGLISNLSASLANTTSPQFQQLSRMLNQLPAAVLGTTQPALVVTPQPSVARGQIDWFGEVIDLGLDGMVTVRLGALDEIQHIKVPIERLTVVFGDEIMDDEGDYDDDMSSGLNEDSEDSDDFSNMDERWISEQVYYEGGERRDNGDETAWLTDEEEDGDMDLDDNFKIVPEPEAKPTLIADVQHPPETPNGDAGLKMQAPEIPAGVPQPEAFSIAYSSTSDGLKRFSVLDGSVPSDHAFASQPPTPGTQAFLRRVAKENKILYSSLPEGILVRTWENRMDLLRVLIIGPKNTPYELAPFLFDFHLGDQFPSVPPAAYFHSWTGGVGRVNPNLYEDGKICLSLLGTWHGERKTENWSASGSSLLQVLVSLMALVLVREPYYNEAGFGIYVGAKEAIVNSALYSEKAYILSRNFVKRVLEQPVQGFEEEIRWLYLPNQTGGLGLLKTVVDHAKDVVQRSESKEDGDGTFVGHEGLGTLSGGARVLLKRTLGTLVELYSASA